ncbi:MAG: 30S ribosome-binding factor RbfA [Candidatus Marinimicrobia bacterium]|nr:30S ribosome-binding factor RbfA [Candidatus Neomarinimicrobiota bacterium]MCF7880626.1 30S ribosome-binding factor RbfA [Candidatus Neomarinimicrobiota bacterium]
MSSHRVRRVEEAVLRVIGEKLITEVQLPQIARVTVTGVDMSPDLKNAKVYFSILATSDKEKNQIFHSVIRKKKEIRYIIGRELDLRFVPELHFELDETAERVARIEELIDQIHQDETEEETESDG